MTKAKSAALSNWMTGSEKSKETVEGKIMIHGIIKHGQYGEKFTLPEINESTLQELKARNNDDISLQISFEGTVSGKPLRFDSMSRAKNGASSVTNPGLCRADIRFGTNSIAAGFLMDDNLGKKYPLIIMVKYADLFNDKPVSWKIATQKDVETFKLPYRFTAPFYTQGSIDKTVSMTMRYAKKTLQEEETGTPAPRKPPGRPGRPISVPLAQYDTARLLEYVAPLIVSLPDYIPNSLEIKTRGVYAAKFVKGTRRAVYVKGTSRQIVIGAQKSNGRPGTYKEYGLEPGVGADMDAVLVEVKQVILELWDKLVSPVVKGVYKTKKVDK